MAITVHYATLLKRAAGTRTDVLDLDGSHDVRDVVRRIAEQRGDPLQSQLVDAAGELRSSVLVFLGDRQVSLDEPNPVADGDVITLMSPISGG
jgi:molybdopterin converting factor small subunit